MDEELWFAISGIVGSVLFLALVALGINAWDAHQQREACGSFSDQTGRVTKYVDYTYWSRDCLTPAENGKWISVDHLRGDQ